MKVDAERKILADNAIESHRCALGLSGCFFKLLPDQKSR
ncbi:MAG: hypothetical protein OFPII_42970 [Osedax symbiont Rs1]|nr:MAG: hypothetical protein OFPII_42970 [Osedax symbiont Rs1]